MNPNFFFCPVSTAAGPSNQEDDVVGEGTRIPGAL